MCGVQVSDLTNKQNRYKVDVNAQYYRLHGVAIVSDAASLICVEGGPNPVSYTHLTLPTICSV
eukprot:577959-Rhodomonas_salina.2